MFSTTASIASTNASTAAMDSAIIAALIAAFVAACAGILNFFLTIHRNKQDGITKYRMDWIETIRQEFATVLGWEYWIISADGNIVPNSIDKLRNAVGKISLCLNVRDEYDSKILSLCFTYLKEVEQIFTAMVMNKAYASSEIKDTISLMTVMQANDMYQKSIETKACLTKKIRVYLKTEWTRVKVDSSILKIKHWKYWCPFKGFLPEKAIKIFENEYIEIDTSQS